MAAPDWVDDEVALVLVLVVEVPLCVVALAETEDDGKDRVLALGGAVDVLDGTTGVVTVDVKVLEA